MILTLNPLLPRLWWFKKLGGFSEDLFELRDKPRFVWLVRASSAAPNFLNQRRKQAAGGVFLFGYFILDKQNKVSRLEAKRDCSNFIIAPLPNPLPPAGEGIKPLDSSLRSEWRMRAK